MHVILIQTLLYKDYRCFRTPSHDLDLEFWQDDSAGAVPFEIKIDNNDGSTKTLEKGTSVGIGCTSTTLEPGAAKPTLKWYHNNEEITADEDSGERRYVTTEGPLYLLNFEDFVDGDGGVLKCEGELNGQTASDTLSIEILKPIEVLSKNEQFGILGQDGDIECDAIGTPPPMLTWKFSNTTDIDSGGRYIIDEGKLTIKTLTFDDAGEYICSLFVRTTFERQKFMIKYTVVDPPKIPQEPTIQPNNPKEGDDVTITCSAEGTPKPTYAFKRGETPITDKEEESVDEVNGILTLKSITRKSEAQYTCVASNQGGIIESTTSLDVKIPPTITVEDVGSSPSEGEKRDVRCSAQGDPKPTLKWQKIGGAHFSETPEGDGPFVVNEAGGEPDDAEIKTVSAILRFESVRPADSGDYMCSAISIVGKVNKTIDFDVKYKPHFDTDFKETEFYGWRGHRANLTCMASANELAIITWYIPSEEAPEDVTKAELISTSGPYTVETLQRFPEYHLSSSSLIVHIQDDDKTLYRNYLCKADNGQEAVRTVTLKEATAPERPTLTVLKTFSTMVTLEVTKPTEDGGQPVNGYEYQYETADGSNLEMGVIEESDIQGDSTQFSIKGLEPSTSYVISIKAKNVVSTGSAMEITITTEEVSAPVKLEITSSQEGIEPTSYTLQWAKPEDGGSPITKFVITYQKVNVDESLSPAEWQVIDNVDPEKTTRTIENKPDAREYKITGLQRNSFYDVRIIAVNAIGDSLEEFRIIKTSTGADDEEEVVDDKNEENKNIKKSVRGTAPEKQEKSESAPESGI
ncbi:ncam-related cell adhesion molecule [Plakobranchus ocellatus]|uniref:Ncam-related cell adhesion molecule n=1 Tax=Plakobranchus ocellatus TaxID=259542 RepID=A0AAV4AXX2_9GAST|nr:ncam-related cell adhesion molecule [Plakobranchus ocellatus]